MSGVAVLTGSKSFIVLVPGGLVAVVVAVVQHLGVGVVDDDRHVGDLGLAPATLLLGPALWDFENSWTAGLFPNCRTVL